MLPFWQFKRCSGALIGPTKHYGYNFDMGLFFATEDYVNWFWHDNSMNRIRKQFIEEVNSNLEFLGELKKRWLNFQDKHDAWMAKLETMNFSELNDHDLLEHYDKLYKLYCDSFGIAMAPVDAFSMYSADFLEPLFLKILEDKGMEEKFYSYLIKC